MNASDLSKVKSKDELAALLARELGCSCDYAEYLLNNLRDAALAYATTGELWSISGLLLAAMDIRDVPTGGAR